MVIDNASVEPGLRNYLRGLDWIDELMLRDVRSPRTEFATAMNEIVNRAKGEIVLIWTDDVQFIVEGGWMADCVELLIKNPWIGNLCLNCLRRATNERFWTWKRWMDWKLIRKEAKRYGRSFRHQRIACSSSGFTVRTHGWTAPGIQGAGNLALSRTGLWRTLGPWNAFDDADPVDASGGGESEMLKRFADSRLVLHLARPVIPVAAAIVTDPTGTRATVRGDKRYGVYLPPPDGTFYYRIHKQENVQHLASRRIPVSFEELVEPLGYSLPFDGRGNLLKTGVNPSVVSDLAWSPPADAEVL
jgi:hypothetical protein